MNLSSLFNRAKRKVDERGGMDALKEDAAELKDIARGRGSATDKAKRAGDALKDPGAPGGEHRPGGEGARPSSARSGAEAGRDVPGRER